MSNSLSFLGSGGFWVKSNFFFWTKIVGEFSARQSPPSGDAHLVSLNRQWSQLGCGGPTIDPGRMALGSLGAARGAARAGGWGAWARARWFVVFWGKIMENRHREPSIFP